MALGLDRKVFFAVNRVLLGHEFGVDEGAEGLLDGSETSTLRRDRFDFGKSFVSGANSGGLLNESAMGFVKLGDFEFAKLRSVSLWGGEGGGVSEQLDYRLNL